MSSEASNRRREPLTWETVKRLEESGSYASAQIAANILHARERRPWWRRLWPLSRVREPE